MKRQIRLLLDENNVGEFVVVDIGAGGANGIGLNQLVPFCTIHAVEPRWGRLEKEGVVDDEKQERPLDVKKWVTHPVALAQAIGQRTLHITDVPSASSLYRPNETNIRRWRGSLDGFKVVEERVIDCVTLEFMANTAGLGDIDYLKLDTQGSELEILMGGGETLNRTAVLSLEVEFVELYNGQPLFGDVVRELSCHGFRFVNFTHGHAWRGLDAGTSPQKRIWSDALFVRDRRNLTQTEVLRTGFVLIDLGYEDEAIWFMQDHGVGGSTILRAVNVWRIIAQESDNFVMRKLLLPIYNRARTTRFPGRRWLHSRVSTWPLISRAIRTAPLSPESVHSKSRTQYSSGEKVDE